MTRTAGAVTTTRSPFSLLRDSSEAEQVLILTYAANLDFFERFALGEARGLQAATTIVSDATMVEADPVTVRGAGVRYLDARAVCPGGTAFHPKLLAIVGSDRATIAIGSGNLTLAGWHSNEELWTVLHADQDHGPSTLPGIIRFLRALGDGRIQLSAETAVALDRVTALLDVLAADQPGPRLVSTLDLVPILNQLPVGPVDELIVYSPYYDAQLMALDELAKHMAPDKLTVFVQPQTSVDGQALAHWLDEHGGELRWCGRDRFRHGKLIEWTRDGVRETLTGSPNVSRPALMRVIGTPASVDGSDHAGAALANCELGLIWRIDESLAPASIPEPGDGVAGLKFTRDPEKEAARPVAVMLGATLIDQAEVHLRLAAPLVEHARIQIYDEYQDWKTAPGLPELPAAQTDYRVPAIGLPAGTALRLFGAGGASNEVFVVDPSRAQQRPYKRVGPESGPPEDLILYGGLDVLYEIAALMRPALLKLGALIAKPNAAARTDDAADGEPEQAAPKHGQTLEEYLAACATVLDEKVVEWALAIPSLPSLGGRTRIDKPGVLTNETDDDAADAGADEGDDGTGDELSFADKVRKATAHRRRQWRLFCERALSLASAWPMLMRAYLARLVLNAIAADLWTDEAVQAEIAVKLITVLASDGDDPTHDEAVALASYAATAIALLREQVHHMSVNDEAMLRYRHAAVAAASIIQELDPDRIEEIMVEIAAAFGQVLTGEDVFEIAAQAEAPPTGITGAITLLRDEYDTDAFEENGALVLADPVTGIFERELLRAAGLVSSTDPVLVRGRLPTGAEAVCIWEAPFLLLARRNPAGINGRVYQLPSGVTPKAIAEDWNMTVDVHDKLPTPVEDWYPGLPTPIHAAALLALAGLT